MLKMKCPACEVDIVSPFLAEINQIDCPHCYESVPVKEVVVFSNGFSYFRSQLTCQIYRYKELLHEAQNDYQQLVQNPRAHAKSKETSKRLVSTLEEIMAGTRNNYRVELSNKHLISYRCNDIVGAGGLLNLSANGACLQLDSNKFIPDKGQQISLILSFPGVPKAFTLNGKVAWQSPSQRMVGQHEIGVIFQEVDKDTVLFIQGMLEELSIQIAS